MTGASKRLPGALNMSDNGHEPLGISQNLRTGRLSSQGDIHDLTNAGVVGERADSAGGPAYPYQGGGTGEQSQ